MKIVYIEKPKFEVDFQSYESKQQLDRQTSSLQRIAEIGRISISFFFLIANAFVIATWKTIKSSPHSFAHTVLSDFDLREVIYRVVYWVIGLGMCWATLFFSHLASKFEMSNHLQVEGYASPGLDLSHIASAEAELDVSSVPEEIQVRTLLEAFDQINFTDSSQPGFFTESTRKSNRRVYSVEELRKNLKTLIDNVENRTAFFGTPPAYNTEKLFTYYQYIEDATRLTLEKVLNDIKQFENQHPDFVRRFKEGPISAAKDDPSLAKEYQDLLENRSRLALDLAFTGEHCGGRYTGDVACAYNLYCKQNSATNLSLTEQLHSLLAQKRREIADSYIASLSQNTHTYSEYMQKLGGVLGLPGTANIVEHLSLSSIDTNAALTSFLSEYTEDYIISAVQEKFCNSQSFREAVYEWIKSNVGEWNKDENTQNAENIISLIESIKNRDENDLITDDIKAIEHLNAILEDLQNKNVKIPKEIPVGSSFIEEMFALEEVKNTVDNRFKSEACSLIEQRIKMMQFKKKLKEKMQTFASGANDWTLIDIQSIKSKLILNAKIQEVKSHIQFGENTDEIIKRMIEGQSTISEVVEARLEKIRETEFFVAINGEMLNYTSVRLSKEVIEWLLVDHAIFKPQVVPIASGKELTSEERAFTDHVKAYQQQRPSSERYNVPACEMHLKNAFNRAFNADSSKIIELAESASISYPLWRRVTLIEIPRAASDICSNEIFRIVFSIAGGFILVLSTKKALEILGKAFITKGWPILAQQLPQRCNLILNSAVDFVTRVKAHPLYSMIYNNRVAAIFLIRQSLLTSIKLLSSIETAAMFFKNVSTYGQQRRKVYLETCYLSLAS